MASPHLLLRTFQVCLGDAVFAMKNFPIGRPDIFPPGHLASLRWKPASLPLRQAPHRAPRFGRTMQALPPARAAICRLALIMFPA